MKIINKIEEMRAWSDGAWKGNKSTGFVPTMGALHEGHLSLVRESKKENGATAVSIFVNPAQFGPNEDLSRYPRPFEKDAGLLEKEGVDALFNPSPEEMYPGGYETFIEPSGLSGRLCGLSRPGHFRGVATVVAKLFNIIRPAAAYFGQKDYQQSVIIRRLVRDLNIPVAIKVCPIVREPDGLAMSSRNQYLSPAERKDAAALFQSLKMAAESFRSGARGAGAIRGRMRELILKLAPGARIDYIDIVNPHTLESVETAAEGDVAVLAVYIGSTRLIDNHIF